MEKQPSGRYILKTVGAPTGIKDGLLWAYDKPHVFGEKNVEQWELYPYVRTNAKGVKETYYTCVAHDKSRLHDTLTRLTGLNGHLVEPAGSHRATRTVHRYAVHHYYLVPP